MKINLTATYVFDVHDPSTDGGFSIYRCDTCMALVENDRAKAHLNWHSTLLHVAGAFPEADTEADTLT